MTFRIRGLRFIRAGAVSGLLLGVVLGTSAVASAAESPLGYDALTNKGALWSVAEAIGAHDAYAAGFTGKGIGVALIDTGITRVPGLDTGNVVQGPDLSFESQMPNLAHLDAFGHGTHLASIIAGRDAAGTTADYADPMRFAGIAPDATLLNVKVGAHDGAADVTQVIAAIDWVVAHRDDHGLNIRVLTLAYGTDSLQAADVDPLVYAVEQAWKAGIVVVVAGGNGGSTSKLLTDPARSPYVLAVGADDDQGTPDPADDTVPTWASRGSAARHVDLVAPAVSVLGLRVPGGFADERNPQARVGGRFAKGSGTSQAAAVVSGAAALLLQQLPQLTPDEVKRRLMGSAHPFASADALSRGRGLLDVADAVGRTDGGAGQAGNQYSTGTGSIQLARGNTALSDGSAELSGEIDIFGRPWDGASWAAQSAAGTAWVGGLWRGAPWSGDGWDGDAWRDGVWTSPTWGGNSWGGNSWGGNSWGASSWSSVGFAADGGS